MTAVAFVESPAQLVNAAEWAARRDPTRTHLVILGPTPARTRFQMHRVQELLRGAGFRTSWLEVRGPVPVRAQDAARAAAWALEASEVIVGDPYSGVIQGLLALRPRPPRIVVVDDGTATVRYAEQWARGEPLQRWHLPKQPWSAHVLDTRVGRWLGRRSSHVELFTAMPLPAEHPPATVLDYAWTRDAFGPPTILDGVDLMGSSLVETGMVDEAGYLRGVQRWVDEAQVRRYLPHRAESATKLARIAQMGVEIVRPELPMEWHARIGPVGRRICSFPSTVLHTLPIVLQDVDVTVASIAIDDEWFTTGDAAARGFVRSITSSGSDASGDRTPVGSPS